jgi:hypothetical protein
MLDQTSPSRSWTPPPRKRERRRGGPERPAYRAVGDAIVAGGLARSVSLYPLPDGPQLLDLFPPKHESSSESLKAADSTFLSYKFSDSSALKLPDLVKLVELNHNFPDFATDGLLDLVTTYGLPDVVKSLELLGSLGPLRHSFPDYRGGGGGGGSADGSEEVWPALMMLLEFLKQNPPDPSGGGLWDVITNVFPKLALSLGIPDAPAAPPPEARVSAFAAAPVLAPIEAPVSAPPDPPVSGFAAAPVSAPAEAPIAAHPEPGTIAPDPPKPDPPKSDPPSSPGGGTDAGSPGDSGSGSGGGTGGGSGGGSPGGE